MLRAIPLKSTGMEIPRPGYVMVEHSHGMWEYAISIPVCIKQGPLKFVVLLLCLALLRKELDWPARSQDNGLDWDINHCLCRVVFQWDSTIKTDRRLD